MYARGGGGGGRKYVVCPKQCEHVFEMGVAMKLSCKTSSELRSGMFVWFRKLLAGLIDAVAIRMSFPCIHIELDVTVLRM